MNCLTADGPRGAHSHFSLTERRYKGDVGWTLVHAHHVLKLSIRVGKSPPYRWLLAHLFDQFVNGRGDSIFDIACPAQSRAAEFVEVGAPFVTPFFPHATRGDVRDHVVGVAADPSSRAELCLEP